MPGIKVPKHAKTNSIRLRISASRKTYYLLLFLACVVGFFATHYVLIANGRGMVWIEDGLQVQLNGLIQIGVILRGFLKSLIAGNGLIIDEFLFTVGYGADVNSICQLNDPLNWLSVFIPSAYTEYLYYVLSFIRTFLSAITFSAYCFYRGNNTSATFVGALCYAFSGYSLFWGMLRHPFFLNPVYLLPLVLLGAERIFDGKSPLCFSAAIALSFFINVYFSYMICLFVLVYCICKYIFIVENKSLRHFGKLVAIFVVSGLLGILISAISTIPNVLIISGMDRVSIETAIPIAHQPTYYLQTVSDLIGNVADRESGTRFIGPTAILLLSVFFCCRRRFEKRMWTAWTVGLVLVFICTCVPYLEHVIHGFSYVTSRWFFLFDFCIAYAVCLAFSTIGKLNGKERRAITITAICVLILSFIPALYRANFYASIAISLLFGLLVFTPLGIATHHPRLNPAVAFTVTTLAGVAITCSLVCGDFPYNSNYQKEFLASFGSANSFYTTENPFSVMNKLPKNELSGYRYSYPTFERSRLNESLNQKRNAMNCYYNYNQYIDTFRDELGIADTAVAGHYVGSGSRLALEAFSGSKYYVAKKSNVHRVPATYEQTKYKKGGFRVYKTDYSLPLGMLFQNAIPRSRYTNLNMIEKQEALLQACVIDDDSFESMAMNPNTPELQLSSAEPEYHLDCTDGMTLSGLTIEVAKPDSELILTFDGQPESETYLCFTDLEFSPSQNTANNEPATIREWVLSTNERRPATFKVTVKSALGETAVFPYTRYHVQYSGKNDWAINAGYSKQPLNELRISFSEAGTYTFSAIGIGLQPIEPVKKKLSQLQKNSLESIQRGHNTIQAKAHLNDDNAYIVINQAFYPGWMAKVDGEDVQVLPVDTGFIGLFVSGKGEHVIELRYHTPGVDSGVILTAVGLLLFAITYLYLKRGRRRS